MKTLNDLMTAFVAASPRKMDDMDYQGYAGVEGTGFIASTETGDIVIDVSETSVAFHFEPHDEEDGTRLQFSAELKDTTPDAGIIVVLTMDMVTEQATPSVGACSYAIDAADLNWPVGFRSAEIQLFTNDELGPYRLKIRPSRMSRGEGTMYSNDSDSIVVIVWND